MSKVLDPRLEFAIERYERSHDTDDGTITDNDEVFVIAKVNNVAAWEGRSEVSPGVCIPILREETSIVTARVPVERLYAIADFPEVLALTAPAPLFAQSSDGTPPDGASAPPQILPKTFTGAGVVVGIVDHGCDFAHQHVRTADGTSRIEAIWAQGQPLGAPPTPGHPKFGRLYTAPQIASALGTADPYTSLGYGPPPTAAGSTKGAHGTHVMSIACGNDPMYTAAAPGSAIIFVDPATTDIPRTGQNVVHYNFGDSAQLLEAVSFIFTSAGDRPCVVNISLGMHGGPHDGSTLVEEGIDALLEERPNRAVVLSAGNYYAKDIHASGDLVAGQSVDLHWKIEKGSTGHCEVDIWYSKEDLVDVELIAPTGAVIGPVGLDQKQTLQTSTGQVKVLVVNRTPDNDNGCSHIGIFLEKWTPHGTWTIRLRPQSIKKGTFHAWIERTRARRSRFTGTFVNDATTLGSIACGRQSIVVGAYHSDKPSKIVTHFSSAGPTRDGREKPEICAPGNDIWGAHSRTQIQAYQASGTSMAAPHVTGTIAQMFEKALRNGITLDIDHTRRLLLQNVREHASQKTPWDPRYGYGLLNAGAALSAVPAAPSSAAIQDVPAASTQAAE